jgi:hypothetical protein
MLRRYGLLVSALVAMAVLAPVTDASARRGASTSCKSKAGKGTLAKSRGVYAFQSKTGFYYVCSGRGKVRKLPDQNDPEGSIGSPFVIAGSYLAWVNTETEGIGPSTDEVYVMNVKTGKITVNAVECWPGGSNGNENVQAMVLASDGSVAWLAAQSPFEASGPTGPYVVVRIGSDRLQSTLAQGPDISGLTTGSDGSTVSWTANGVAASAPLA